MRSRFVGLSLLVVAAVMLAAPAQGAREKVGAVDKVQERAEAVYQEAVRPLDDGAEVIFRDLLRTGDEARLQATLLDGSKITMGAHAALTVDELVYQPADGVGELSVKVVEGAFLFVSGQINKLSGGSTTIETQVGTLGIRGTTVWGGSIDGGFGILALEGTVTVDARGGQVTLAPGQGTMFSAVDAAPQAPVTWPDDKVARAFATIEFSP